MAYYTALKIIQVNSRKENNQFSQVIGYGIMEAGCAYAGEEAAQLVDNKMQEAGFDPWARAIVRGLTRLIVQNSFRALADKVTNGRFGLQLSLPLDTISTLWEKK